MSDAPERIWADEDTWFAGPGKTERAKEYVRADLVAALIREAEARAAKAHEKEIAVWSEKYAALERERDKWFEGAGAHHVASMQQAQRADRAKAALSAAQQRIKLLCDNDEWNLGLQEALEVIRAEAAAIRGEGK